MSLEDYKTAIDKVPKGTRIDFSGMCEPFVNKSCSDMILYAAHKGFPLALYTTLQGATEEDYIKIKDVPFEVITIHIPDNENRSTFQITQEYLDLLAKWNCSTYSCHGTISPQVLPYINHNKGVITYIHDRAGNVDCRPHKSIAENKSIRCRQCGQDLNHNVLLPDGTLLVCCMDYGMTEIFGNLFTQSYEECINSITAKELRKKMNYGECICKHCYNAIIQ